MSQAIAHVTEEGEVVGGLPTMSTPNASLAVSLARAEVDQQIATARAMPRSINRAVKNIMGLATLDELSAEECVYALPRGGKPIKGPSIRMAEIIASQWGNCRVGARVVHVDRFEKYVEAEGVFHDLETNTATTSRVRRRLSDKKGQLLNDDMIVVTGNAACSIAKRNAILGGVPKAVWRKAYEAVESVIAGDVKTLTERRDGAMKAFAAFGVTPEQVCAALDVGGLDDVTLDHLVTLTGMRSALKSGEASVEELFPRQGAPEAAGPKGTVAKLDKLAAGKGKPKPVEGEANATSTTATAAEPAEPVLQEQQPQTAIGEGEAGSAATAEDASTPAGQQEPDEPAIDETSPDYARGKADKAKGLTKCLTAAINADPVRTANWRAGFMAAEKQGEEAIPA